MDINKRVLAPRLVTANGALLSFYVGIDITKAAVGGSRH